MKETMFKVYLQTKVLPADEAAISKELKAPYEKIYTQGEIKPICKNCVHCDICLSVRERKQYPQVGSQAWKTSSGYIICKEHRNPADKRYICTRTNAMVMPNTPTCPLYKEDTIVWSTKNIIEVTDNKGRVVQTKTRCDRRTIKKQQNRDKKRRKTIKRDREALS